MEYSVIADNGFFAWSGDEEAVKNVDPKFIVASVPPEGMTRPRFVDSEWVDWTQLFTEEELQSQLKSSLEQAVQDYLDNEAQRLGYDDILSACTYASASNPFQAEGQSFVSWRGNVWATCYQILADVEAGIRAAPTKEELLAELPIRI
jgi:uncharacterized protein YodC (DUF2158 family)